MNIIKATGPTIGVNTILLEDVPELTVNVPYLNSVNLEWKGEDGCISLSLLWITHWLCLDSLTNNTPELIVERGVPVSVPTLILFCAVFQ